VNPPRLRPDRLVPEQYMTQTLKTWLPAFCIALVLAGSVHAGGGDYDQPDDTEDAGPAYFGFVWDTRGATVTGARVILKPKVGKPVEVKTNVMGLYRGHVSKEAKPADVEILCDKAGYKLSRVVRRTSPGMSAKTVETDCVMQRI
jgi:hypothetical protein